jgi:cobalt-zinc-cadmium efflux system protein
MIGSMYPHVEHARALDAKPSAARRRILATLATSSLILIAEAIGGWLSGSLALLADAGHMLTDVLALAVAFTAISLSQKPADDRRTYGYRRLEILAALANGVALVVVSGSIFYEAVQRWLAPRAVDVRLMAAIAVIGLVANLLGLWLLRSGHQNLNVRGAFLHILGDALSSCGVVLAAGIMALTGWTRIDAVISFVIAVIIIFTSLSLLREVFEILLEAAPRDIDTEQVRRSIAAVSGVAEVHDLHVWSIASGLPALSAHVVVSDATSDSHAVREAIQDRLRGEYAIGHSTLQIEQDGRGDCGCCQNGPRSAR